MPLGFYQYILRFLTSILCNSAVQPGWLTTQTPPHHDFIDNMGRNEKTKLFKHQTAAIACKSYSEMFFCPVAVPTKKPPLTRLKTRETRQKRLNKCSSQFKSKCHRSSTSSRCTSNDFLQESALRTTHPLIK
jgi:hypothetical protein